MHIRNELQALSPNTVVLFHHVRRHVFSIVYNHHLRVQI